MTKIKDLREKDRMTLPLLIKSCVKGVTSKGSPYLNLQLQDNTGLIDGKLWDAGAKDLEETKAGHVEEVSFEVLEYNHSLQLRVNYIRDLDQDSVDLSQYVMSSALTQEDLKNRFNGYLNSLTNENYRKLVAAMLKRCEKRFFQYPAASRIHHNYMGGLAEHTLGMAALAEDVAGLYPNLDRDLLIAGVLVHDMGKTAELGGLISSEYTEEGKLIGHISIGHAWLLEEADRLGIADSEEAILLRHMVLAHHGKHEFGSPVLPEIPEAEALFLIDNMDARMNTLRQTLKNVRPGTWSQKVFALDNRQFYKPKKGE